MIWALDGSSMLTVLRRLCGHVSGRPERRLRPVEVAHARTHLPAAVQKCEGRVARGGALAHANQLCRTLHTRSSLVN